jgi:hypothetical protein
MPGSQEFHLGEGVLSWEWGPVLSVKPDTEDMEPLASYLGLGGHAPNEQGHRRI